MLVQLYGALVFNNKPKALLRKRPIVQLVIQLKLCAGLNAWATALLSIKPQSCNISYLHVAMYCLDPSDESRIKGLKPTIASPAASCLSVWLPVERVVKPRDVANPGWCNVGRKSSADAGLDANAMPIRQSMMRSRRGWSDRAMAPRLTFAVVSWQNIPLWFWCGTFFLDMYRRYIRSTRYIRVDYTYTYHIYVRMSSYSCTPVHSVYQIQVRKHE